MVQGGPYIYKQLDDVLAKAAGIIKRKDKLTTELESLKGDEACDLDDNSRRKVVSSLLNKWNKTLFEDAYKSLILNGSKKFQDDYARRKSQLPMLPAVPAGFKDLSGAMDYYNSSLMIKEKIKSSLATWKKKVIYDRQDLASRFSESYGAEIRSNTQTAEGAFNFIKHRLMFLHSQVPEGLRKFISIYISDKGLEMHYLYSDGSIDYSPDFTYRSDVDKNLIDKFRLSWIDASFVETSLLDRISKKADKAAAWVKDKEAESDMMKVAISLYNTLYMIESSEKDLRQINRELTELQPTANRYRERERMKDALHKEWSQAESLKTYPAFGAFLAGKKIIQSIGKEEISRLGRGMADELGKYGLYPDDLTDIRWPEYAAGPEKAKEAKESLLNRLVQVSRERCAAAAARAKSIEKYYLEVAKDDTFFTDLCAMQDKDPVLFQILEMQESHVQVMKEKAAGRDRVPLIPTGQMSDYTNGEGLIYPEMVPWHLDGKAANICLKSGKGEEDKVYNILNELLFNMLMAFPAGKVRLHFVDLNLSGRGQFFLSNLDPVITGPGAVTNDASLRELVASLQAKMTAAANLDVLYDVVVLLDAPKQLSAQHAHMLQPLCENGYKGKISFVAVDTGSRTQGDGSALLSHESFYNVTLTEWTSNSDSVFHRPQTREMCLNAFREGLDAAKQAPVIQLDVEALKNQAFQNSSRSLHVPVGSAGGQHFEFRLDQESHAHAFVLGQSGSGKSVFLRDVILGAAFTYAPEDLQLYLIDLKAGGIEFNGYELLPHTKAVLLDDSDRRIILEILRDVSRELDSRGERIRNASRGIVTLEDYNRQFPSERLSQVMIIVDECQRLFSDRPDAIQKEISDIMDKIAEMGRAFGIHLVLATQTLHGSVISAKVRKNISDFYLFKGGMADGLERLMDDASSLSTGQVLFTNRSEKTLFQAYYLDGSSKESAIESAARKSSGHKAGGQFVFTGRTSFSLLLEDVPVLRSAARRGPACMPGREITVGLKPLVMPLQKDMGENILILGSKASHAVSLAQQVYLGMMLSDKGSFRSHKFYAIDCQDDLEMDYYPLYNALESYGSHLVSGSERGELIASLAAEVREGKAEPSVILLLSQERFRPLMMDAELPVKQEQAVQEPPKSNVPSFLQSGARGGSFSSPRKSTYRSELAYLLEHGSEQGVHFIWEVDRLPNLLADATLSRQSLMRMFRNILMLRSVPDSVLRLGLPTEVDPDKLNDADGRVRAWWIDLLDNRFRLFTPFLDTRPDELDELFKA